MTCPACGDLGPSLPVLADKGGPYQGCERCGTAWLQGAAPPVDYGETYFRGGASSPLGYRDYLEDAPLLRLHFRRRLRALARHRPPPGLLLEVGCATGILLQEARSMGWQVRGIEPSPWAVEQGEKILGQGVVRQGTLPGVEIPAATFDVVVADDVLEHLPDPLPTLVALRRALKPGGLFTLQTPALGGLLHRVMGRRWFHFKADHPVLFTRRGLQTVLQRAGFAAISIEVSARRVDGRYLAGRVGHWAPALGEGLTEGVASLPGSRWGFPLPTGEFIAFARGLGPHFGGTPS